MNPTDRTPAPPTPAGAAGPPQPSLGGAGTTSPLRVATRVLGGLHALGGLGCIAFGAYLLDVYRTDTGDDPLIGLAFLFGGAGIVTGVVLVVLGLGAALARTASGTYACALAAGLFLLLATGTAGALFVAGWSTAVLVVPLATIACAVVGLARGGAPR